MSYLPSGVKRRITHITSISRGDQLLLVGETIGLWSCCLSECETRLHVSDIDDFRGFGCSYTEDVLTNVANTISVLEL